MSESIWYEYTFLNKAGSFVSGETENENKGKAIAWIEEWYADDDHDYQIGKWLMFREESKKSKRKFAVHLEKNAVILPVVNARFKG